MIREIVTYDIHRKENNEILHKVLRKVEDFKNPETIACIADLNETLDDLIATQGNKRGAIGLSANQIDYDLAISAVTLKDKRYIFANPRIVEEKGNERLFRIGCFSVEDYRALVRYNDDIIIAYEDENGERQTLELKGDQSCVVQHEMDHLVGMLLFEKAEDMEEDFFIPRETVYKDGKIPFENHGLIFELKRKLGLSKAMTAPAYYSSLFNDYTDYRKLVEKTAAEKKDLLDLIRKHTPDKGSILEADQTTSALSVYLNTEGYDVTHLSSDPDMYELALNINAQNETSVKYAKGDISNLPYSTHSFNTVFSYQEIESFNEEKLAAAFKEALRTAETFIFQVPTIRVASNALKGNEILRGIRAWRKQISHEGYQIIEEKQSENGGWISFVITK